MDRIKVYDAIFWFSLASILLWVILKVLGYINTPILLEQYPTIGAIFGAGAFFQKVNDMERRLGKLEQESRLTHEDIHRLDKRMIAFEAKI